MKTKTRILLLLYALIVIVSAMPSVCLGENEIPMKEQNILCSTLTTVNVSVDLTPDCPAVQYCDWEIFVYDVSGCFVDVQPIAVRDYYYGTPTYFYGLTINNAYVRVCVRPKAGSHCYYENNAPKCECQPVGSGTMYFYLDICNP
jgi:hypothetical protein